MDVGHLTVTYPLIHLFIAEHVSRKRFLVIAAESESHARLHLSDPIEYSLRHVGLADPFTPSGVLHVSA